MSTHGRPRRARSALLKMREAAAVVLIRLVSPLLAKPKKSKLSTPRVQEHRARKEERRRKRLAQAASRNKKRRRTAPAAAAAASSAEIRPRQHRSSARSAWRTSTMRRRSHAAISSTRPACKSSQRRRGPTARGDHATAALPCYAHSAGSSRTSSKLLNRRNIPNF